MCSQTICIKIFAGEKAEATNSKGMRGNNTKLCAFGAHTKRIAEQTQYVTIFETGDELGGITRCGSPFCEKHRLIFDGLFSILKMRLMKRWILFGVDVTKNPDLVNRHESC